MRIVVWSVFIGTETLLAALRARPGVRVDVITNAAELAAVIAEADALMLAVHSYDAAVAAIVRERAKRLRWIQLLTAGTEGVKVHGVPAGVVVTNAGGTWSPAVAEHAITLLLGVLRGVPELVRNQQAQKWDHSLAHRIGAIESSIVLIVGFGSIGREIAKRLRPFEPTVLAISRRGRANELADEVYEPSDLRRVLPRADAIIVTAPLSPETVGLFGPEEFGLCKRSAVLVNVSRGKLVDTDSLTHALKNKLIAGAALDVTDPEPLPVGHELWSCPNVIISAHIAGGGNALGGVRLAAVAVGNIERLTAGQPMLNPVDLARS